MSLSDLSPILKMDEDFNKSIEIAHRYFDENLNNRLNRPSLFEKDIYIEAKEIIDEKPQGFWHIISLDEKHTYTKVLPCINDENISKCNENCNTKKHQITIKYGTETRNICLLRASRIPWIIDLINLANKNSPDIISWKKQNNHNKKLYIRYKKGSVDFVVIFSEEKHYYRIISAYPVFEQKEKEELNNDYKRCTSVR